MTYNSNRIETLRQPMKTIKDQLDETTRKHLKTPRRASLAMIIPFAVTGFLLGGLSSSFAALRQWTGAGPNAFWSTASNWSPVGAPQPGDALVFPDSAARQTSTNDLVGLVLGEVSFVGNGGSFNLHGYGVTLTNGITCMQGGAGPTIHLDLTLALSQTFVADASQLQLTGDVDLGNSDHWLHLRSSTTNSHLSILGAITGDGHIRKHGPGELLFGGPIGNSFQGDVFVYEGTLVLNKGNGGTGLAVSGYALEIGLASWPPSEARVVLQSPHMINDAAFIVIHNGELDLNGWDEAVGPLWFVSGKVETGTGTLLPLSSIGVLYHDDLGWGYSRHGEVRGHVFLQPTVTFPVNDFGILLLTASLSGPGNLIKEGSGRLYLSATNDFSGAVTVNDGIVSVYGSPFALGNSPGVTLNNSGALELWDMNITGKLLTLTSPNAGLIGWSNSLWSGSLHLNFAGLARVTAGDPNNFSRLQLTGPITGTGGLWCGGREIELAGNNTFSGGVRSGCELLKFNSGAFKSLNGPLEVGGDYQFQNSIYTNAFSASGTNPLVEVRWLNHSNVAGAFVAVRTNGLVNLNNFNDTFGDITFYGGRIETGAGLLGINGLVTANYSSSTARINGRIQLNPGYREFRVFDNFDLGDDLLVNATISGPGHLQKTEYGRLTLTAANAYTGLTLVDEGLLGIQHPAALGAGIPGTSVAAGATLQLLYLNGATVGEQIALLSGPAFTGGELDVFGNATLRNQFPSIYACLDVASNAVVFVGAPDTLIADGFISGTGPWYKFGTGTLVFSNANANTYTGDTLIQYGTLELRKPNGTLAVPGNLVIGPAHAAAPAVVRAFQNGGLNANATVTVNADSWLDLNGYNQSLGRLNLNDGGDVQTGAGTLSFPGGGPVAVGSLNVMGSQASSSFSGRIGLPPNSSLFFTVAPYAPGTLGVTDPELVVSALIPAPVENVNFERAGLYKSGAGELRLAGNNTFNGRVEVAQGTLSVGSATALGSTFDATYVTGDASLALINGLTILGETLVLNSSSPGALDNRGGNNYWLGPVELARTSGIRVSPDWTLAVEGVIRGAGGLLKNGGGTLTLGGSGNNTYAGNTHVNEGTLLMAKASGLQAVPADLIVGQTNGGANAVARHLNNDQIWANTTVNHGGLLDLNGFDEWTGVLTLNGGGDVQTGSGTIYPFTSVGVNPGTGGDPSVISGRLGLYQGTIPFTVGAGVSGGGSADCLISATVLQYSANAGLQKKGAGVLRLTGTNTYTGSTTISGGTLWVDGVQAQSTVLADTGTTLQGSGTVGPIYFVGLNTRILPGSSPGILTCGGLTPIAPASGTLQVELNGPTPGAGYDQLDVRGPVNLTGLALSATLGFGSAVSNTFTLIQNDGADAVVGTFSGLPQGKKLYVGGELFQISYTGGDGNDVVLTRLNTPPPPILTIEQVATNAVRLLWPTNDPPFNLQTATNLAATNWFAATPPPTVLGTNHVVTNSVTAAHQFYRLSNP